MNDFRAPPPPPGNFNTPAPEAPKQEVSPQSVETPAPEPQKVVAPEQLQEQVSDAAPETAAVPEQASTENGFKGKVMTIKDGLAERFNALPGNKKQVVVAAGIFAIGLMMGGIMFGGSDEVAQPVPQGLQGVISNPDIKEPLKRCGQVEASSPCVLYIMNSYTYEKLAQDFFETAVSVTRRKDLVIRMDNVRYATMRIPPGYFAQIKIPAYK